jgi:hypothetical protein
VKLGPKIALENPMNVLGAKIGKRPLAIQPYQFGHMEQKETWLWLHRLPPFLSDATIHTVFLILLELFN